MRELIGVFLLFVWISGLVVASATLACVFTPYSYDLVIELLMN